MRRPGDTTPPPPGGRVAARKQLFVDQRSPVERPRATKKAVRKSRKKKGTKRAR